MQTRMKKPLNLLFLTALAVCALAACQTPRISKEEIAQEEAAALAKGCKPVKYGGNLIPIIATARGSGRQCLVQDLLQRNVRALDDGQNVGSPRFDGVVIFDRAKDLDLDMQGHLASSKPFDNTVVVSAPTYDRFSFNLRIHNGRIQTPGLLSIGVLMGSLRVGNREMPSRPNGLQAYPEDSEPLASPRVRDTSTGKFYYPRQTDYQPLTRYTAENLTIESGGRGIVMVGADNVVRNNTIEVDGKVAVYLYGPRPIIEGNTFIVHLDSRDGTTLPATLKLRDADGAIIRNNRFLVKSGLFTGLLPGKAEAAINLLTSRNVLIENNTIEDARQLVRKDEASSVVERGNRLK